MAKPTQKELAALRADYLIKRETILQGRVNSLQSILFDKVYNKYLESLEKENGIIVNNAANKNLVAGLDKIYKTFNEQNNIPVVKGFVKDINGIQDANVSYFSTLNPEEAKANEPIVKKVVDRQLGLNEDGGIKKGGFTDKFINDKTALKRIKNITTKAITKQIPFSELRANLKEYIQGDPKIENSGGLQQYYRNYAYDTMHKVDRMVQHEFGDRLGLKYFQYVGGLIKTSRPFCVHYNGRILNVEEFSNLIYDDLSTSMQEGIPSDGWDPINDLGGFGCRHSVNYVSDSAAETSKERLDKKASEKAKEFNNKK